MLNYNISQSICLESTSYRSQARTNSDILSSLYPQDQYFWMFLMKQVVNKLMMKLKSLALNFNVNISSRRDGIFHASQNCWFCLFTAYLKQQCDGSH